MKVLHLMPSMDGGGGAERSLAALVPFISTQVHLHVVTWTGTDGLRLEVEAAGAEFTRLHGGGRLALIGSMRRLIRTHRPDLVHTTLVDADIVGRCAAMVCGVPVVTSLVNDNHGLAGQFSNEGRADKRLLAWSADLATARAAVAFHALTDHVASVMSRRLLLAEERISVIPRGRSSHALGSRSDQRRIEGRRSVDVHDERPLVVAAARHEYQKGLDTLVRAVPALLRAYPTVQILIGGRDGRASAELHALVDELGLADSVRFIGQRDDVAELMCAADVWCVPSRWEGLGSILLEAMCLEVPVVATAIPPILEVAGTPPGFELVPPDDAGALAHAIAGVLSDPRAARDRASRARVRFERHYSAEGVGSQMVEFYRDSVARSRWTRWTAFRRTRHSR